ncbi:MAG: lipolytic protein G-D-S-L family [Acidobacteria bacterium]|nr:lipolytic protein G-D-S-L family [Acidobacteriota bacterium]
MPNKLELPLPSRREWMRSAALFGAATQAFGASKKPLTPTGVLLFQGDSITDAGRNRERTAANDSAGLGRGYPLLIGAHLLARRAQDGLRVFNRGISGNKVPDLEARWQADTLDIKPDMLSILIGVNDIWHKLNGKYDGTVESYEKGYAALLERTRKAMPYTRIIVCEPFVLRCGAVTDAWFPEMEQRRAAAERVAKAAGADWVPFQAMFNDALKHAEPAYWAADGVHPTAAGHGLMAKTWLEVVKP